MWRFLKSTLRIAAAFFIATLLLMACSDGHADLARSLDRLDVPENLVAIDEIRYGPSTPFAGDRPHVDRYYVSEDTPDETCEWISTWAEENGLTENPAQGSVRCTFTGTVESAFINVIVTTPMKEIPAGEGRIEATPIELDHGAVVLITAE